MKIYKKKTNQKIYKKKTNNRKKERVYLKNNEYKILINKLF